MAASLIFFLQSILTQTLSLFGIFFVFGFILSILQEWTNSRYRRTIGWRGILWTAWIGTPVHEISHWILAKLFRHRVIALSLFSPNKKTGGLGHMEHTFDATSLYQRIGNFFIGAAPMFGGSFILLLLLIALLSDGARIWHIAAGMKIESLSSILHTVKETVAALFSREHMHSWRFWVFLYLSFAVAAHLAPSHEDRKNMWGGFFALLALLVILDVIALLIRVDAMSIVLYIHRALGALTVFLAYAAIVSFVHWIAAVIVLAPFRR